MGQGEATLLAGVFSAGPPRATQHVLLAAMPGGSASRDTLARVWAGVGAVEVEAGVISRVVPRAALWSVVAPLFTTGIAGLVSAIVYPIMQGIIVEPVNALHDAIRDADATLMHTAQRAGEPG